MSYPNCTEIFLDDVVSVIVYKSSDCNIAIPPTVPIVSVAFPTPSQVPVFKSHISEKDGFVTMPDRPTLKIANSRSSAGNVYTHDLQIPTVLGRDAAESAVSQLQGSDFYIIYQRTDGSRSISYALPNTSVADLDESISPNLSVNVKLKVQSMSPLINIV